MFDTCYVCKNIFTVRDIKLVQEDKFLTRQFDVKCSTCGTEFKVWIKQTGQPTISAKDLEERKNFPRKDTIHVKPGPPTEDTIHNR